jgi:alanine racemase
MRATKAVIRLDNLLHNIGTIQAHVGKNIPLCMAVKANAYGHGAIPIAKAAVAAGVKALGVAIVAEGVELREAKISAPIYLFSLPCAAEMKSLVQADLIPFCTDEHFINEYNAAAKQQKKTLTVHLKVDTGMGRIGCTPENAAKLAKLITEKKNLKLGGICTHFPVSDSGDPGFTRTQINILKDVVFKLKKQGLHPGIIHAANSGAIIDKPESFFDMVRPGIILYGYYPSHDQDRILTVKPVMELITQISFIKKVNKGTSISYGRTYISKNDTFIATLPVGYGDGYSRLLSNRAQVFIDGNRYPVVGRVCMDQIMINLGAQLKFKEGREVILFGAAPGAPDAEEIADLMGTIPYEVTCLITKRVPRVYINHIGSNSA